MRTTPSIHAGKISSTPAPSSAVSTVRGNGNTCSTAVLYTLYTTVKPYQTTTAKARYTGPALSGTVLLIPAAAESTVAVVVVTEEEEREEGAVSIPAADMLRRSLAEIPPEAWDADDPSIVGARSVQGGVECWTGGSVRGRGTGKETGREGER